MLQGETLTVRYLRIQVTSSTPIKHSVLAVTPAGKATLDDVRIDFNGSRMEYASASPITLTGDVVINDLEVHSFAIPNNTDHSVTLTDDWPIVRMSGKSDDVPIQIKGGRIHTITAGGAGAASNFCTLIGAQGHATISDNALGSENAFVLTNFTFDLDGFTPASGQNNLRCISNVPDYTKIHRCQFVRGTGDALYGVWAKDSQRVKITKNTVQFYGNARTVYFFRVTHSGTPSDYFPRHCDVSDNHIFLTKGQGILVAGKDGTDFGMYNHVNDNMFERSSVDGDPYEGIAVNESKWSSCQGNVVNNVDADNGVVAIDYVGEQTGHVPALASIATQNVVRDGTYV
ncbi:MAG: hypothetical protein CMK74_00815 [Pseudomonadales bacterium]|nr:hypothetical protein [Pseudomonadales bacterium]